MFLLSFMKIDFSAWKFLKPRLIRGPQKLNNCFHSLPPALAGAGALPSLPTTFLRGEGEARPPCPGVGEAEPQRLSEGPCSCVVHRGDQSWNSSPARALDLGAPRKVLVYRCNPDFLPRPLPGSDVNKFRMFPEAGKVRRMPGLRHFLPILS